jgi:hypothetical protein
LCDDSIEPDHYDELELFLGCEELARKTSLLDMSSIDMNSILQGCLLHCVDKSHNNLYLSKIIKEVPLPKYERTYTCFTLINERGESSQFSSIGSKPGYVELPFTPHPSPKIKKKRRNNKKKRSKKREEKVLSRKHVDPFMINSNECNLIEEDSHTWGHYYLDTQSIGTIEGDYMSIASCSDHD